MPDNKDPLGTTLYGKTNWPRTKRSDILKQYPGLEYVSGEWGNDKYKYKLPSGEYAYYGITKTGEDLDPYQFGPISSPVVAKAPSVKATAAPVEQVVKQPTIINPISNEPQKQSINFASPYGYSDPNTGKAYSYDASYKEKEITPDVQNYRYGGLIKKVRGYAEGGTTKWGGTVDPKTGEVVGAGSGQMNSATGSGIDIASQVAGIGGDYMQSKAMNEDGTVDVGLATGSKALTMGAKGASMGMAFGPYGALIGAGVGGLAGAGIGYFGAKNVNDEIDAGKAKAAQDKLAAAATEKYQSNMAKQMLERQQGFKDGGEIKGGLLPKSKTVDRFDPKNYGNKPMLSEEELNKVMLNDMKWETESFYKIPPKGGSVINKDVISYDKYGNKTLSEPWYSADVEPTKTIPDSVLRAAPTYANGGEIKGKGGPKDDKISAKVEAGSFIVPAENKEAAKQVKKMIAPSKKKEVANLDQEDGTEVKLSDGEFLFSPEEKEEIINELGEHFLEALAPNAEHESEEMREGGLTPGKAKKMLKDGTANGQPLTEKQRGYFGLIASGYKCGGMVKGYKEGGEVEGETENTSMENPSDKFEKLKQEVEASLQKAYPNQKVEVIYKGDKRNISQQKTNLKKGASKSAVSLHQLGGARDFNIKIDGRILGNNKEDIKVYKEHLWKNAEKSGLYHLKEGKGNFGDTDPYHIGLVEEKGDGTAFKELIAKYPSLKDSDSVKATIKDIQEYKKNNPNDKTYDIITNALTVDEKPIKKAPIIVKEKPVDFVKSESDKLTQERNKLEDNTKLEKRKEEHLDYAKAVKRASERVNMYKKMYDDYDKVNSGGNPIFSPSVAQKSSAIRAKKELLDKYIAEKKNFDNVAYAYKKSQSDIDNWGKEDGSKVAWVKKQNQNTIPVKSGADIEKINNQNNQADSGGISQALRESLKFTPSMEGDENVAPPISKLVASKEMPYESMLSQTAQRAEKDIASQTAKDLSKDARRNDALTKGLGIAGTQLQGLGNYFLPFQQYKMGQKFLAESGERPKGQIDPDFQRTINNAQANAQFGYTPEEQALLDSKNINALRAGQNAAKNYAGGSAGNAFSMTRQAAGDYYSRGLQAAIGNKQLKMDKQAYADELQKSKAAMNRNLFLDNLNAWQQEQQAGGNLVGAGLQNLIGSQRYNQEMQFNRELAANSNPYAQYRTNPING